MVIVRVMTMEETTGSVTDMPVSLDMVPITVLDMELWDTGVRATALECLISGWPGNSWITWILDFLILGIWDTCLCLATEESAGGEDIEDVMEDDLAWVGLVLAGVSVDSVGVSAVDSVADLVMGADLGLVVGLVLALDLVLAVLDEEAALDLEAEAGMAVKGVMVEKKKEEVLVLAVITGIPTTMMTEQCLQHVNV